VPAEAEPLGEDVSIHAPFWMGAAAVVVGAVILVAGRRFLGGEPPAAHSVEEAELVVAADVD
jgi:ACDE family multidrug resistance protein